MQVFTSYSRRRRLFFNPCEKSKGFHCNSSTWDECEGDGVEALGRTLWLVHLGDVHRHPDLTHISTNIKWDAGIRMTFVARCWYFVPYSQEDPFSQLHWPQGRSLNLKGVAHTGTEYSALTAIYLILIFSSLSLPLPLQCYQAFWFSLLFRASNTVLKVPAKYKRRPIRCTLHQGQRKSRNGCRGWRDWSAQAVFYLHEGFIW